MTRWIADELGPDVPLHFTAFHPDWKMLDKPPTPPATLDARAPHRASPTACATSTPATSTTRTAASTYCHGCGARLIGRDWFVLTDWHLDADGRCAACGTPCAGRFEPRPGTWGARRLPVRLAHAAA